MTNPRTMLEAVRERAEFCDHINQRILPQSAAVKDRAYLLQLVDAMNVHRRNCPMIGPFGPCSPVCTLTALLERKEC